MLFNFNIRRTKGLVWTLNIVAIFCIAGLFLVLYQKKAKGEFKRRDIKIYKNALEKGINKEQTSGNKRIDINDYNALWLANISGRKKVVEAPPVEGPDEKVQESPLSEVVQIMVILESNDPAESRVRLKYLKEEAEVEKPFELDIWSQEGDLLKPPYDEHPFYGKILTINEDSVVFSYMEKEETLYPDYVLPQDQKGSAEKAKEPTDVPEEVAHLVEKPPEETVEYKPDHWFICRKEQTSISNDYEKLLRESPIVAVKNRRTGKTELTLTAVPENSLAARRGFTKGDVLVSINGIPIHNKAGAINYFKSHPDKSVYTVRFLRNGREMEKTFVAPPE
jgi:hypothetical protein